MVTRCFQDIWSKVLTFVGLHPLTLISSTRVRSPYLCYKSGVIYGHNHYLPGPSTWSIIRTLSLSSQSTTVYWCCHPAIIINMARPNVRTSFSVWPLFEIYRHFVFSCTQVGFVACRYFDEKRLQWHCLFRPLY